MADAGRDTITEVLSPSEFQARLPGVTVMDSPGFGGEGKGGQSLYLGQGEFLDRAGRAYGLSGWQHVPQ